MSAEDREKSRLAYQEKRIREAMLVQQAIQRQDEQSEKMKNFSSLSTSDSYSTATANNNNNNTNSTSTRNATYQLANQLSNVVFTDLATTSGTRTATKAGSTYFASSSSSSRFSDAPTVVGGDTVLQGFHDFAATSQRPKIQQQGQQQQQQQLELSSVLFHGDDRGGSKTVQNVLQKQQLSEFDLIQVKRRSLPVYAFKDDFLSAVAKHQVIVLSSETGSGKTTQLPVYLLEAGYSKVVCTQPRVLAATSVAERVAQEMGVACGARVGYRVRFESRVSDRTELVFCTDGMLLKECMTDADLKDYAAVMIDEAHERSVNTDLLLGLIRDLIRRRADLRIVVASATMVGEKFIDFFGPEICKKFEIPGRQFPVKSYFTNEPQEDYVEAAAYAIFQTHLEKDLPGDILVFLTGQDDIERCEARVQEMMMSLAATEVRELIVLPLYSALPMDKQRRIYFPAPIGTRKVILATNVAETSITIDGIVYVIDTGLCKQKYYDPKTATEALAVVPISKAAAAQRKGRAGRTRPGECIRLYTKQMFQLELDADPAPEILRSSLTSVVLTLKSLGVHDFKSFDFVDPPSFDAIAEALKTLLLLGAVTPSGGRLTQTGRFMAELPLEPNLAKMLLTAQNELKCGKQAASVVAILSLQNSLFFVPKDKRNAADSALGRFFRGTCGDLTGYCQVFAAWESERCSKEWGNAYFLNYVSAMRAREVRNQLVNTLLALTSLDSLTSDLGGVASGESSSLLRLDDCLTKSFLSGFFMNASTLSADMVCYTIVKSPKVADAMIHPSSCFFQVMSKKHKKDQEQFEQKSLLARAQQQQQQQNREDGGEVKFRFCDPDTGKPPLICFAEMRCTPRTFLNHVMSVREDWVKEAAPGGYFSSREQLGNASTQAMMTAAVSNEETMRRRQRGED